MISTKHGQTTTHKMLQKAKMDDASQRSVNQFVTIKYRYALASLFFLSISILLMWSVPDVRTIPVKLSLLVIGLLSIIVSFVILSKSSRITKNNDIHNTDD